jgi:hypothetical protein
MLTLTSFHVAHVAALLHSLFLFDCASVLIFHYVVSFVRFHKTLTLLFNQVHKNTKNGDAHLQALSDAWTLQKDVLSLSKGTIILE